MKQTTLLIVSLIFAAAVIILIAAAMFIPSIITSSFLNILMVCFIVCGTTWVISTFLDK